MHVLVVFKSQLRKDPVVRRTPSVSDVVRRTPSAMTTKIQLKDPDDGLPVVTWDDVRYLLEFHFGLHRANVRPVHQSFLTGMLLSVFQINGYIWDNDHRLMSMDHIHPDDAIVLCRKPMAAVLSRYVPFRFLPKTGADIEGNSITRASIEGNSITRASIEGTSITRASIEGTSITRSSNTHEMEETKDVVVAPKPETEDEMLQQIMVSSPFEGTRVTKVQRKDTKKHPSDYEYNELKQPRPAATYVCDECAVAGHHFRMDCHLYKDTYTKDGDAMKRPTKISVAHGIPKRFLQIVAANDTPNSSVLRLSTGELVSDRRVEVPPDRHVEVPPDRRVEVPPDRRVEFVSDRELLPDTRLQAQGTVMSKRKYDDMCGRLWFDFEDYVLDQEAKQKRAEDEFYVKNPRKKLQSMCTHWLRGLCQKEWSCEYLHKYNMDTMPICSFFLHSVCAKGDECAFKHVLPPSTLTANACLDYALGFCARGGGCERQHLKRTTASRADFEDNVKLFEVFIKTM